MTDTADDPQQEPDLLSYRLTDEQDVLLRTIATEFARSGKWPVFDHAISTLEDDYGMDARNALTSLPRVPDSPDMLGRPSYGFTALPPRAVERETPVALTVAAALVLPELRQLISEPFLRVMHHMIKVYWETPRDPYVVKQVRITSEQLRAAVHIGDEALWALLPGILRNEIATRRCVSSIGPEASTWSGEIDREILRFRDCFTVEDYVAKVSEIVIGWAREAEDRYRPSPPIRRPPLPGVTAPVAEDTEPATGQAPHTFQQLHIHSGDHSPVNVNASMAYADQGGATASASSAANKARWWQLSRWRRQR
ncbi:hypothetical protein [Streptomyces sp. NPDC002573]|uniref:hypothetical protein n=1 Tax=Streptomyces sp. NPDC002573 TaxID=3364651 RepID=UPI0036961BB2